MKRSKRIIISILLMAVFLLFGYMVRNSGEGILFDRKILEFLHKDQSPQVFSFMKFISFIGSEIFLFPAIALIIIINLINKEYYISKLLLFNTLGSFIANHGLKILFNRTRPLDFILVKQSGLSYPSGHSMVTMSMYLTIAYLLTRNQWQKGKRVFVYSLALLMILTMGVSRLYLGVHWPTDIIGGYIGGYIVYRLSINIIKEKRFRI